MNFQERVKVHELLEKKVRGAKTSKTEGEKEEEKKRRAEARDERGATRRTYFVRAIVVCL